MKQQCKICSTEFDFCPSCHLNRFSAKARGFCSDSCSNISTILQRHAGHRLTAEETIEALKPYGIDSMKLQPGIKAYYDKVLAEIEPIKQKSKFKNKKEYPVYQDDTSSLSTEVCVSDEDIEATPEIE